MPSGNPGGGGGNNGSGGASANELPGARDFSLTNYYSHTAGQRRGNAAGFSAFALVRPFAVPAALECVYGNFRVFGTLGGWFVGLDANGWRMGVAQQSDGAMVINGGTDPFESLTPYRTAGYIDRLVLLTLVYDGTVARLYVNGNLARTLTPASGYLVSDAAYQAMLGRNNNAGAETPCSSVAILGHGYVESVVSAANVLAHYRDTLAANGFVAGPFSAGTAAPIALDGTTVGFTATGTPVVESKAARW